MTGALWFTATCAVLAPLGASALWPQAVKAMLLAFAALRLLTGRTPRVRREVPLLTAAATLAGLWPPVVLEEAAALGALFALGFIVMLGARARATYG